MAVTSNTAGFNKEDLMLDGIRKRSNSIIVSAIFAAIIIVFIFWGVNPGGKNDRTLVATVDGTPIAVKDYANLYKKEVEYFRSTLKDRFTDEMEKKMDLKDKTLNILINRALAINAAKEQGIKVSDVEIQDAIKSIPAFSSNNAFNKELYFRVLSANRIKPADFEKSISEDILASKMRDQVLKGISVTDAEVKSAYEKDNRKFDFNFIMVDAQRFKKDVTVTDAEAKEYLHKNASEFMVPVKIKAFYAHVNPSELVRNIKLSDADIKAYYERNLKDFELPEMVKAKHILIRPDPRAKDKEKAKRDARAKAELILKKIKNGGDFSKLAAMYSQDPGSKKQGGELGWFQRGVMVKPFENAAFALKKGEVSGIVETDFGYHIIMVTDRKEAGVMPLADAQDLIKKTLGMQKARSKAREMAVSLEKSFKSAKSLEDLKKAAGAQKAFKASVTDFFSEDDKHEELAGDDILREAVFQMLAGEVSGAIDTPEGLYVVKVLERKDAHVQDYAAVSGKVKEAIAAKKAHDAAEKTAQEILKKSAGGKDLAALARKEHFNVIETGYFSKAEGFIPKIGVFTGDMPSLFEASRTSPYFPQVITANGRFYVLKLKDVKEADPSGLDAKKEEIRTRLLSEKQEAALNSWLKGQRSKAKIKIYENRL